MSLATLYGLVLMALSALLCFIYCFLREWIGRLTVGLLRIMLAEILVMMVGVFLATDYVGWHWAIRLPIGAVGGYFLAYALIFPMTPITIGVYRVVRAAGRS